MRKVKETFKKAMADVRAEAKDWLDNYKYVISWIVMIIGYLAICAAIGKWFDRWILKTGFGYDNSEVDEYNDLFKKLNGEDALRVGKLIGEATLSILRRES